MARVACKTRASMTFRTSQNAFPKPSRTARKLAEKAKRTAVRTHERDEKLKVRRRDRVCRFPRCGCRKLGLPLEVAHMEHKGRGGNPRGDRSTANKMILLCRHRHQDAKYSLHHGTLRFMPDTLGECGGPLRWEILWGGEWRELVVEGESTSDWQEEVLDDLAGMEV